LNIKCKYKDIGSKEVNDKDKIIEPPLWLYNDSDIEEEEEKKEENMNVQELNRSMFQEATDYTFFKSLFNILFNIYILW